MNATNAVASITTILAIDLGKHKSVVCLLDKSWGRHVAAL